MCDHDCNERSAVQHGKPHAAIAATKDAQWAYLTLRGVPYATDFTEQPVMLRFALIPGKLMVGVGMNPASQAPAIDPN